MFRTLILLAALMIFWMLLSGEWHSLLLTLGMVSCLLVVFLSHKMGIIDDEGVPTQVKPFRLAHYFFWLVKEIFNSNIIVAQIILSKKVRLQPEIFRVPAEDLHDVSQVIYANSITMTPGTVSTDLGEDWIEVHALTKACADSLREGEMYRRIKRLDSSPPPAAGMKITKHN